MDIGDGARRKFSDKEKQVVRKRAQKLEQVSPVLCVSSRLQSECVKLK